MPCRVRGARSAWRRTAAHFTSTRRYRCATARSSTVGRSFHPSERPRWHRGPWRERQKRDDPQRQTPRRGYAGGATVERFHFILRADGCRSGPTVLWPQRLCSCRPMDRCCRAAAPARGIYWSACSAIND
eukprot:6917199-Prymnesium_polylepis.1